jgi:large subunit ribosomal protein L9
MQVILMDKVVNLGGLGDIVKVKDGYARNFLIPQGKAKRATEANKKVFEARRAELEKAQGDKLAVAQGVAAKLEGLSLQMARKAGVDGRLFGSVGSADIAEALATQGIEIEKSAVRMPLGPIKQLGESQIEIALHSDVVANIVLPTKRAALRPFLLVCPIERAHWDVKVLAGRAILARLSGAPWMEIRNRPMVGRNRMEYANDISISISVRPSWTRSPITAAE